MLRNVLLLLVASAAPTLSPAAEEQVPEIPARGDPAAGEEKITTCAACHGRDGIAMQPSYANLAGQNYGYLLEQMRAFKSGARQANLMMGQLDNLSEQDLKDVAAYYASQPAPVSVAPEENLELGERIYRAGLPEEGVPACAACHLPRGNGNGPAAFPALAGQTADYVVAQLEAYRAGERTTDEGLGGMMRDIADRLDDEEIAAVANYVRGLH